MTKLAADSIQQRKIVQENHSLLKRGYDLLMERRLLFTEFLPSVGQSGAVRYCPYLYLCGGVLSGIASISLVSVS